MCCTFLKILLSGGDRSKVVVGMWPWRSWDLWNLSQASFDVTVGWMWGGGTVRYVTGEKSEISVTLERVLRVSAALQK